MPLDPRTPVVVGGGQLNVRDEVLEPVEMIARAVRLAAEDAGAPGLASSVTSFRIVGMLSWPYRDPGLLVAERLGATARHTVHTGTGGSHPQALVDEAAEDVAAGRADVVVVAGAEAWRTHRATRRTGVDPDWTVQPDSVPQAESRPDVAMFDPTELAAGADRPTVVYPLFEQALRVAAGRSTAEHRDAVAALWAGLSRVAAGNPHAWLREPVTAEQIATPGPDNRVVSAPYTKLMCSNNAVEQAAAVIVCSVAAARAAGVPEDRWVFPRSGVEAADTAQVAARPRLDGSVAIRLAGREALRLAGVGLEDLGPVDLYSCFPSAVQVAAHELGLPLDDPDRPLSVTGGLTFAGGPWNNYSTHAIASVLGEVRGTGRPGLVTANSGYLTRHAIGVYAATPGDGFRRASVQAEVDAGTGDAAPVEVATEYDGPASLEAWTVPHDHEGRPERAVAALRLPSGERTLARSDDADLAARLVVEDLEGSTARVAADATFSL